MKNVLERKGIVSILVCLLLVGSLVACADRTRVRVGYDALKIGAVLYDSSLKYAGAEYLAGRINEEQKDKVISIATRYRIAWLAAKAALVTYKQAERMGNQDMPKQQLILNTAVNGAAEAQKLLIEFMATIGGG